MRKHLELPPLNSEQMEILNGSLLGDGCIVCYNKIKIKNRNGYFSKIQSCQDILSNDKKDYLDWHFKKLTPFSSRISLGENKNKILNTKNGIRNIKDKKTNYYSYKYTTHAHPNFTDLARKWYLNDGNKFILKNNRRIKIVPKDLRLTSLSTCIWFMDDGTLDAKNGNATFCTHGFTFEECEFLSKRLYEDVGIKGYVRKDWRGYPIIFVGVESYKDLINLIKPHVEWECLKNKLNESYNKIHQIGENHSQSTLNELQVKEIIKLRLNKIPVKEIAKLFNVSEATVSMISSGARWGHLKCALIVKKKPRVNNENKQKIIELSKLGISQKDIALQLDINQSTVSRILKKYEL